MMNQLARKNQGERKSQISRSSNKKIANTKSGIRKSEIRVARYIFPPAMEYYYRKRRKGMVSKMENGHGKVWICLLILVLAAVVIGLLYYTTAAKEPDEEGFLIRAEQMESGELRSEELQSVQTWNG